jgi:hypothetical protein
MLAIRRLGIWTDYVAQTGAWLHAMEDQTPVEARNITWTDPGSIHP